jgi:NTP pyrophosphatase (non-canonical NTP hydrolase)
VTPAASDLDDGATLSGIQRYVAAMEAERGFTAATVPEQALLLGEEVGELFKAIRKSHNLATADGSVIGTVEEELADVLIFVCSIANRLDIDLTTALRRKEAVNCTRTWSTPTTR